MDSSSAGSVNILFSADTAKFISNVKLAESTIESSTRAMEATSARLERAWNRELVAQDRLAEKYQQSARAKDLAALKADILARSEEQAAETATRAEQSYNRLMTSLNNTLGVTDRAAQGNRSLAASQEMVAASGAHQVSSMAASSGALRLMEGNFTNNIRAAERFLSTTLGLGGVLESAFQFVGAAALLGILVKMSAEAYKAEENFVHLKKAIEGLNDIQITVDKKVGAAEDSIEEKIESILEKSQGKTVAIQQKLSYQSAKPVDLSDYFYDDKFKKLPDDVKTNYESTYKSIAPADLPDRLAKIRTEVNQLTDAIEFSKNAGFGMVVTQVGGFGPATGRDYIDYYKARLTAAQQIQAQVQSQSDLRGANLQDIQGEGDAANKAAADKAARNAEEASRKLEAARSKAAQAALRSMELARVQEEQQGKLGALADEHFWEGKIAKFEAGSTEYLSIQKRIEEDQKNLGKYAEELGIEQARGAETSAKNAGALELANIQLDLASHRITKLTADQRAGAIQAEEYTAKLKALRAELEALNGDETASPEEKKVRGAGIQNQIDDVLGQQQTNATQTQVRSTEAMNEDARVALRDADALSELADMNRKTAESLEQLTLAHQVSTGEISKHGQALALAEEHAADYAARLSELNAQRDRITTSKGLDDDQRTSALDKNDRETAQVQAEADRTALTDKWALQQQTAVGGFLASLQEMAAAGKDYSAIMKSLTQDVVSGVNKTLLELLTTRNHQGEHLWRALGHDLGVKGASTALNMGEGEIAGGVASLFSRHGAGGSSSSASFATSIAGGETGMSDTALGVVIEGGVIAPLQGFPEFVSL